MIQTDNYRYLSELPKELAEKVSKECKHRMAEQFYTYSNILTDKASNESDKLFDEALKIGKKRTGDIFEPTDIVEISSEQKLKMLDRAVEVNKGTLLSNVGAIIACVSCIFLILGTLLLIASFSSAPLLQLALYVLGGGGIGFITAVVLAAINDSPKKKRDAEINEIIKVLAEQHILRAQILIATPVEGSTSLQKKYSAYKILEIFTEESDTKKATESANKYICDLSHLSERYLKSQIKCIHSELHQTWVNLKIATKTPK